MAGLDAWFNEEEKKLHTMIDEFINDSYIKISGHVTDAKQQLKEHKIDLSNKHKLAINEINELQSQITLPPTDIERKTITEIAESTRNKSENNFTYQDWIARALESFHSDHFQQAADYWLKSASSTDTPELIAAQSLCNRGIALGRMKSHQESLTAYDAVTTRFGSTTEPEILEAVAKAMLNKGAILGQLKRPEEALALFDVIIAHFGNDKEPTLCEYVATALVNKGISLTQLKRHRDAISVYEATVARFISNREPAIQGQVAKAYSSMGFALLHLEKYDQSLKTSEEALRRFLESDKNAFSEDIAIAMGNRSAALVRLGRAPEALTGCNEILTRYKQSPPDSFARLVAFAEAMAIKADALDALDRHDEAQTTCDAMVAEFGKSDDAEVIEEVTKGLREAAECARARNDATRLSHYEETLKKLPQPD